MTLDNFTARQKKMLAIGLMFLGLLTITLGIVIPMISDYYANKTTIVMLQRKLRHYSEKMVSRTSVMQQTAELKNTIMGSGAFSVQKSVPLVLAEMQEKIKNTVASAGGELTSTQNLSPRSVDGLMKLGINASFSGKMENLKNILYELESAKPFMIIENIKIYGSENERDSSTGEIVSANQVTVVADIITYIPPVAE
jgi:general secretion pathway protein M